MMASVIDAIHLDPDRCYRAAKSRDARFDGWFYVGVRTTGIYCRPSCPAVTPKRVNVDFFASAAAAQQRGLRACKRCRPDASPGSPEWDVRSDLVARAMRLIADGVVDREGVAGLSRRLGYSVRQLNRLMTAELGAGPLALARAQRAQTARILIETSDLTMTDIAYAAGFGSVRQFNDTIREVFAAAPRDLRAGSGRGVAPTDSQTVSVRLATRVPFAGPPLFEFIGAHAVPGLEHWDGVRLRRALALPNGHGVASLTPAADHVQAEFVLGDWRDLAPAVGRVRRWLDLDADPVAIDEALTVDTRLAPMIRNTAGLRSPGSVDPFETMIRTIIGQQVSVAGASTVTGRIVAALGDPLALPDHQLTHVFPTADALAVASADQLPLPTARAATIQRVAALVGSGDLALDAGGDRTGLVDQLVGIKGIGPWSAQHTLMRGLGDPDVFLDGDLVARRAMEAHDLTMADTERWRPWRTYALHHLWNSVWQPAARPETRTEG